MPFSYSNQLSTIIGFAEQQNPQAILDVGLGMGQYGFLLRINLENVNLFEIQGATAWQRAKDQWKVIIDGIEGYAGYITPVHDYAHTNLMIGNALEILPTIENDVYELVLAIDILEHFDNTEGKAFLTGWACRAQARRDLDLLHLRPAGERVAAARFGWGRGVELVLRRLRRRDKHRHRADRRLRIQRAMGL